MKRNRGRRPSRARRSAGFTLVELLIAVAIIGILANLTILVTRQLRYKAMAIAVIADFRNVERAYTQYSSDTGKVPADTYPGQAVPELAPYLKNAVPWTAGRWRKLVLYDWENWVRNGKPMYPSCNIAVGISITTKDTVLVQAINKLLPRPLVPCVSGNYTYQISAY